MWHRRRELGRRILSGLLTLVLAGISTMSVPTPMIAYAASSAVSKPRVSYEYEDENSVQIGIIAENENFVAGEDINLKIYLQNNTDTTVQKGILSWKGSDIDDGGFWSPFDEIAGEEEATPSDGQEEEFLFLTQGDIQEEELQKKLKNLVLEPGEVYVTEFQGRISSDADMDRIKTVTFQFTAVTEHGFPILEKQEFTYNTALTSLLPVEFVNGYRLETNTENTLCITMALKENGGLLDGFTGPAFDADSNEGSGEEDNNSADTEMDKATVSDASKATESNADKATLSNADKTTESGVGTATGSDAEKSTASDADSEDEYDYISEDDVHYDIITYGAKFKDISVGSLKVTDSGNLRTEIDFQVESETPAGTYFGMVNSSLEYENKTYKSSQGFYFTITGEGKVAVSGHINGVDVEVKGEPESFPEGDVVGLRVQELSEERQTMVTEALERITAGTDVTIQAIKAVDLGMMADGEESELRGEVEVTFSNLELDVVSIGGNDEDAEEESHEKSNEEASDGESHLVVWHLNEETGNFEDMYGTEGENGEVVMNTTHFSIYVLVKLEGAGGIINVTMEHWAYIEVVDGEETATQPGDSLFTDNGSAINVTTVTEPIYTTSIVPLVQSSYKDIETLSKVSLVASQKSIKNYSVKEVWVTYNMDNLNRETWTDFTKYTNTDKQQDIELGQNALVRIFYMENGADNPLYYENSVTFYDHNVTDGRIYQYESTDSSYYLGSQQNEALAKGYKWLNGVGQGTNYNVSSNKDEIVMGSGQWDSGNRSVWSYSKWKDATTAEGEDGKYLNRGNDSNKSDSISNDGLGIVKGMVTGLSGAEKILDFASGFKHADFFKETTINRGNYTDTTTKRLDDYTLQFRQQGDTYILKTVMKKERDDNGNLVIDSNTGEVKKTKQTGDLEKFYTRDSAGSTDIKIHSNEFWPLDDCGDYIGKDPLLGTYDESSALQFIGASANINASDFKNGNYKGAHNWHFGMRYDFSFVIDDYIGPMNYYFRGDDDFWLFIDNELVVDIGGVHGAVGQTVNIRDWLEGKETNTGTQPSQELKDKYTNNKKDEYKCTVYFMERGGFGSCCYMRCTLPNYKQIPQIEVDTTEVTVTKIWEDGNNPWRPKEITVKLLDRGSEVDSVTFSGTGNTWTYTWNDLPVKDSDEQTCVYTVEEVVPAGYEVSSESSGFTIINKLNPEVKVKVTKVWNDGGNACGNRPEKVNFRLYADGTLLTNRIELTAENAVSGDSNTWTGTFTSLPKFKVNYDSAGNVTGYSEITYSVEEMSSSASEAIAIAKSGTLQGKYGDKEIYRYTLTDINQSAGLTQTETAANYIAHYKFTNTHTHSLNVSKIWNDGDKTKNNSAHKEESILVGLYKKDGTGAWQPVTSDGGVVRMEYDAGTTLFTASFTGLDPAAEYTVKELNEITGSGSDTPTAEFTYGGKRYYGVDDKGIYGQYYEASYGNWTLTDNHACKQTMEITNTLMKIRLRLAKVIDNWEEHKDILDDLREDRFVVRADQTDGTFTAEAVLKHALDDDGRYLEGNYSNHIELCPEEDKDVIFRISEIVPKEYSAVQGNGFLSLIVEKGNAELTGTDTVKLDAGTEAVIVVHNTFEHKDYFHDDAFAENVFGTPASEKTAEAAAVQVSMAALIREKKDWEEKSSEEDDRNV